MKYESKYKVTFYNYCNISWDINSRVFKILDRIFMTLDTNNYNHKNIKILEVSDNNNFELIITGIDGSGFILNDNIITKKVNNIYESKIDPENKLKNELLKTIPVSLSREILPLINTLYKKK